MKKKVIMVILACALLISACGNNQADVGGDSSTNENDVEASASDSAQQDTANVSDEGKETGDVAATYENFLANKAKVHINQDMDFGTYFSFEKDKELNLTLEEITNAIIDSYLEEFEGSKIELTGIEYAYLDCGNDGNAELAVCIHTPSVDDWTEYLIIKEMNGKLECIYSNEAWSRSNVGIGKYGYIYGDGSGGASNHYFEKSYIDAGGKWHYIYGDETTVFDCSDVEYPGDIWGNGDEHVNLEMPLPGSFVFFSFDFNNTEDENDNVFSYAQYSGDYESDNGLGGYFYCKLLADDGIYDEDYPLKKFYDQVGIETLSIKEVGELISEKAEAEGFTPEIANAGDAEWQELEYLFEPDIETYNDDNFIESDAFFPIYLSLRNTEDASTTLHINADGTVEGSYYASDYTNENGNESQKNEFTGKFSLKKKINDDEFEVTLSDVKLKYEAGTEVTKETKTGVMTHTYYVTPPGIDDGGKEFTLYLPGASVSELPDELIDALGEYWKEQLEGRETIGKCILFGNDGKKYLWMEF
ncbi:MAG: hypothetical protein J6O61_12630 [Butyrivibrio sp.]|uniref:hypothetical protein n=1 Tax=Butyrivibrio sp. TaxID=28121 RepID=UPI001B2BABE0|nr:hypothetical protein [Butyrivibrio sp.]MBO6241664.1 hypothetical protein [Butyrivibrio sp.]